MLKSPPPTSTLPGHFPIIRMLCKTPTLSLPQEGQLRPPLSHVQPMPRKHCLPAQACSSGLRPPYLPPRGSAFVDLPVDTPRPQGHRMYSVLTHRWWAARQTAPLTHRPLCQGRQRGCHRSSIPTSVLISLHESFSRFSCLCPVPHMEVSFVFSPLDSYS